VIHQAMIDSRTQLIHPASGRGVGHEECGLCVPRKGISGLEPRRRGRNMGTSEQEGVGRLNPPIRFWIWNHLARHTIQRRESVGADTSESTERLPRDMASRGKGRNLVPLSRSGGQRLVLDPSVR